MAADHQAVLRVRSQVGVFDAVALEGQLSAVGASGAEVHGPRRRAEDLRVFAADFDVTKIYLVVSCPRAPPALLSLCVCVVCVSFALG